MRENQIRRIGCAFAILLLAAASAPAQTPLGSAWTYQGRLDLLGSPLSDTADFEFTLWGDPVAGNQVGSTLPINRDQGIKVGARSGCIAGRRSF